MTEIPTKQNVVEDESQVVFYPLYGKPLTIAKIFDVGKSTVYRWLRDYDEDDLGVKDLYLDLSANMTRIDIEKLREYLKLRNKKWL
ncbi:helix-turn-helix domain-containing protein [Staphylococcus equorum]|uniref:Helix-turn-helix domain-containing protein n=1 Tax=Staphylococcus equorum TaxID=246432 RepID=A0A9X4L3N4_9STAP|nr:helix-turn-helix domain-containing protein [Staphylococcus equorum]MDG0819877.1 helix-turn-helix domain-containing protein [Staphylococcus equorum]MDG0840850.1 helix-turn-helix domain-containing protein [Staphylococcus equorum]MDG0846201.1 helix-turn-helix domain-containing protein [Staphylococcus equorum]